MGQNDVLKLYAIVYVLSSKIWNININIKLILHENNHKSYNVMPAIIKDNYHKIIKAYYKLSQKYNV